VLPSSDLQAVAAAPARAPPPQARAATTRNALWHAMSLGAQPKLAVSEPGDAAELEADRIADQVLRSADPDAVVATPARVQRKCAACAAGGPPCDDCDEERRVQRMHDGGTGPRAVGDGFGARLSGGVALAADDRGFFESRMGRDFGAVRIHTGGAADASARDIGARAYTLGSDIAFADGEYSPESGAGRRLLAHELVHVVQQGGSPRSVQRAPGDRQEEIERSRVSPGFVTGSLSPPFFSMYNFAINDAALKATHREVLDELADLVQQGAAILNVRLSGHADSTGDDVVNGPLSNDRAMAAEEYLTAGGVTVASVSSVGAATPVASNGSERGRSRNRRVDIRFDIKGVPRRLDEDKKKKPPPRKKDEPKRKKPKKGPEDTDEPWEFDLPCTDHPIICGIIGVGVGCLLAPEICALVWPGWPDWPWGGDDGPDDGPDDEPDEEPEELDCDDPRMRTHVEFIPASGDKGNRVEARPLTRCEGNTHGSEAKRSDPNWPHGRDCVVDAGETKQWKRAHLLHGPALHGPGNERRNIILADTSINGLMSTRVEQDAIDRVWPQKEVLWYEVEVTHFTGAYPRPYFAEAVDMAFGLRDPITGVEGPAIVSEHIESNTGHQPPSCNTPTDDDTPPPDEHVPHDDDTPHTASADCDSADLARRVDACVEQARQDASECTALAAGGLTEGPVVAGVEYYLCLRHMRERLLECDRRAKEGTHCAGAAPSAPEQPGEAFDSTLQICRRLLNSRAFHVSAGTVEVDLNAGWFDAASGAAVHGGSCPMTEYHVSLERVGTILDTEVGTGDVPVGQARRLTWNGIEPGEYFLTIWTNNENPSCCLNGTISVRAR